MTPFEYCITLLLTAVSGSVAIEAPSKNWRALGVLVMFLLTVFAGYHGFSMS